MDQESFRSFIKAPRFAASSSSAPSSAAAGVLGGATPRRGHVVVPTKKDPLLKKPTEESTSKDIYKSKKLKKLEGKYTDRAAQRRAGLDDEFSEVIALQDEFERRLAEEAEDAADLEEKRKYLGGDAEHSILVKGLDYALLAKNKADLESAENFDDELEAAFQYGSSSSRPIDWDPAPLESRKRTREEILAAVEGKKKARSGGVREEDAPKPVAGLSSSKFKPIGFKESKSSSKGGKDAAGGEKKLKKKKKKVLVEGEASGSMGPPAVPTSASALTGGGLRPPPATTSSLEPSSQTESFPSANPSSSAPTSAHPLPTPTSALIPKAKGMAQPLISFDDDDDDIFGGVGEYEAPGDSDSDDDSKPFSSSHPPPISGDRPTSPSPTSIKRTNWFSTAGSHSLSPSPPKSVTPLPSTSQAPAAGSVSTRSISRSPSPPASGSTMGRLQGFAGSSVPSVSDLLRMDEASQALAVKKAKKAAWRMKMGLARQDDDDGSDEEKVEIDWNEEKEKEGGGKWKGKGKGKGGKTKEEEDEERAKRDLQEYERYEAKKAGKK